MDAVKERDTREREARERAQDEESFKSFLEHPMTKLSLGMIPAAENPDVMRLLLRAAFDAGKGRGSAVIMGVVMEGLLKDRTKPQGP
jgi:hypothetical protein